jgi:hypothetical protein
MPKPLTMVYWKSEEFWLGKRSAGQVRDLVAFWAAR